MIYDTPSQLQQNVLQIRNDIQEQLMSTFAEHQTLRSVKGCINI